MCNLKNITNQSIHKAETDLQTENTLMGYQSRWGEGTNEEHGVNMHKIDT